jgi:hypothetical protein
MLASMTRSIKRPLCAVALVCVSLLVQRGASAQSAVLTAVIGIDHIPLVVKNLDLAAEDYSKLGFALKPGRFHGNGIRNAHVKFPDGSGIELITASKASDALTAHYMELLDRGEGPAYLGFHARNTDRLLSALAAGGISYSREDGFVELSDPRLNFIFIGRDNRSSTDRPAHFAHANSAIAMTAIWIATSDTAALSWLMSSLGSVARQERVFVPEPTTATVFAVENGRVILLPEAHQVIKGRPVVGASFRVADLDALTNLLAAANISPIVVREEGRRREILVPPQATHGIWLAFSER